MWGQDAAAVEESNGSRRNSLYSSYARTVMGSSSTLDTTTSSGRTDAHGMRCRRCASVSSSATTVAQIVHQSAAYPRCAIPVCTLPI